MGLSALQNFTIPDTSDPANGPDAFETLAEEIEKQLNMRFASVAARDAAVTSPEEGMVAYTSDTNTWWYYTGSAWVADTQSATYTPTLANMAIGTGGGAANTARYTFVGGEVGIISIEGLILFGSAGATLPGASGETIALPSGFNFRFTSSQSFPIGRALYTDVGTAIHEGPVAMSTVSTFEPFAVNVGGTYAALASLAASVPFAWAAGDYIAWTVEAQVVRV